MRLNMDCIRDILLCVEENTGLRKLCVFHDISAFQNQSREFLFNSRIAAIQDYQKPLMDKYENDELIYHIYYCIEADLIKKADCPGVDGIVIADLTVSGHELIGAIREKGVWERLQSVFPKAGGFGAGVLSEIASSLAVFLSLSALGVQ